MRMKATPVSRERLPVGQHGEIHYTVKASGKIEARTRSKDKDRQVRLVARTGEKSNSKEAARRALLAALKDRKPPQSGHVTTTTTVQELTDMWWEGLQEKKRAAATMRRYREVRDLYVLPRLRKKKIGDLGVGDIERHLKTIQTRHGAPTAKITRTLLVQILDIAVRHDAIPRNPARFASPITVERSPVTALTIEDAKHLRSALEPGEVRDVLDVLLGTGCRIGEALALRWEDIDLDSTPPRLSITGTVVRSEDGIVRQPRPKSQGSMHRLVLPAFTAATLRARPRLSTYVFPSSTLGLRDPNNFRKKWRQEVTAAGHPDVNPHKIRATVATRLARASSVAAASAQLGHASESITLGHYVERLVDAPDMAALLEPFGASE